MLRIVPEVIVERDDGAGIREAETEDGVFQDVNGGVAAVKGDEVVSREGHGAQGFARYAAPELGAFFASGLRDVGPEQRLVVAIEAEQARVGRGGDILQQPGGGAAFEAADF